MRRLQQRGTAADSGLTSSTSLSLKRSVTSILISFSSARLNTSCITERCVSEALIPS